MSVNVELLERTLTYIRDHPEDWEQSSWCGTKQCFAGHTVALSGFKTDLNANVRDSQSKYDWEHVSVVAQDLLGLKTGDQLSLFFLPNDFDQLERKVKDLINEAQAERIDNWGKSA